jgi:hypothetical protein
MRGAARDSTSGGEWRVGVCTCVRACVDKDDTWWLNMHAVLVGRLRNHAWGVWLVCTAFCSVQKHTAAVSAHLSASREEIVAMEGGGELRATTLAAVYAWVSTR